MPPRHAEDLFSSAYDGTLSERQRQWFDQHQRECAQCRQAFAQFQSSVDAVRALPAARMPIPVHLPSTAPVAEQRPLARFRTTVPLRFRPGMATGLAAVAAAVIVVVALTHQTPTTSTSSTAANGAGSAAGPLQAPVASCPLSATGTAQAVPGGFDQRTTATEPGRPGQQLVLATPSQQVHAGASVSVYAVLTAPLPAAAAPQATVGKTASIAAVPCVTVARALVAADGASASGDNHALSGAAAAARLPTALDSIQPPLLSFQVPPGTPKGTVLRVTATVPADYPQPGDPAMTAELTITVG